MFVPLEKRALLSRERWPRSWSVPFKDISSYRSIEDAVPRPSDDSEIVRVVDSFRVLSERFDPRSPFFIPV